MPLNYSIVLLGNPRKPDDPKKAYARSQVSKELTLKGLSQRRGADSAEVFTATNITGVNIQFVPGDDLKKIFNGMSFNPVPSRASVRAVLRAEKAGETTVDLSKKPNEGGGSGGEDDRPGEL